MKKILVLIDRDGTINYDNKYYLGSTKDWKSKVKILPTVITGLKLLNTQQHLSIDMITNQPGVAIQDFPLLTKKRAGEVCQYIINTLKRKGAIIDNYFICPHASPEYTKKRNTYEFNKNLIYNCDCIKPKLGMVFSALKKKGITKETTQIFVIGDRESDVQTALNIDGTGILTPFVNEPGQTQKVKKLIKEYPKNVYIAKNFLDAAKYIVKNIQ